MDKISRTIKYQLENTYDIPFHVKNGNEYRDLCYKIWPDNDLGELFEFKMLYRQGIRLIIEIYPQRYAAGMLNDMQNAQKDRINIFLKYIDLMKKHNAKIEMNVNKNVCPKIDEEIWQQQWKSLKLRISVIPEKDEEEEYEERLFSDWANWTAGMILALLNIEKLDISDKKYAEGGMNRILINKYERNPVNRQLCLAANGYTCKICGFNFEQKYGKIGKNFIHVHHIEKISLHKEEYYIDPETDLIPVCPNCHAMLHKEEPPMKPEKLLEIINDVLRDGQGE